LAGRGSARFTGLSSPQQQVGYGDTRSGDREGKILSVVIAIVGVTLADSSVALAIDSATLSFTQVFQVTDVQSVIDGRG